MRYPAIEFVGLHGRKLAVGIGFVVGLLAAVHVTVAGLGPVLAVLSAVVAGLAGWGVSRVCAELVEVIAETLLPR